MNAYKRFIHDIGKLLLLDAGVDVSNTTATEEKLQVFVNDVITLDKKLEEVIHQSLCSPTLPHGILADFHPPSLGTLTDNFSLSWGILGIDYNISPVTPSKGSNRAFLTQ